jgi:hypothetical protein
MNRAGRDEIPARDGVSAVLSPLCLAMCVEKVQCCKWQRINSFGFYEYVDKSCGLHTRGGETPLRIRTREAGKIPSAVAMGGAVKGECMRDKCRA